MTLENRNKIVTIIAKCNKIFEQKNLIKYKAGQEALEDTSIINFNNVNETSPLEDNSKCWSGCAFLKKYESFAVFYNLIVTYNESKDYLDLYFSISIFKDIDQWQNLLKISLKSSLHNEELIYNKLAWEIDANNNLDAIRLLIDAYNI